MKFICAMTLRENHLYQISSIPDMMYGKHASKFMYALRKARLLLSRFAQNSTLMQQIILKKCSSEFHENPINGLVAGTRSRTVTDGRWYPHEEFLFTS